MESPAASTEGGGFISAQKPSVKPTEDDHAVVFEFGAAGDWSRAEGFHPGGTFAFEVTPIEELAGNA